MVVDSSGNSQLSLALFDVIITMLSFARRRNARNFVKKMFTVNLINVANRIEFQRNFRFLQKSDSFAKSLPLYFWEIRPDKENVIFLMS